MNKRIQLDAVALLAVCSPIASAIAVGGSPQAIAQPVNSHTQPGPGVAALESSVNQQPNPGDTASEPFQTHQRITIPASSAIPVTFCSSVKFNAKQKSSFPVTVYLTRPILDSNGNELVPVNSLVSAQLKPTRKGVQIKAKSLVIHGRVVPIQTSVLSVPVLSDVDQEDYYGYQQNPGVAFKVADGLNGWLGNQEILSDSTSSLLGFGLAVASGVSAGLNKPKVIETMEIPQKSTFVFQLLSSVDLPSTATQAISSNQSQKAVSLCSEEAGSTQDSYEETSDSEDSDSEDSDSEDSDSQDSEE